MSQYLDVEAPTITRTLARMEKMGWVIRQQGKDKGEIHIKLTEKACPMYAKWQQATRVSVLRGLNKGQI